MTSRFTADMRTHFVHRTCNGEIVADWRQVVPRPWDKEWPRDLHVRVPYCVTCKTVVNVTECVDERLPPGAEPGR